MKLPWEKQHLDDLIAQGAAYAKIGVCLGSACMVAYSLHIGRFPQGLTLGDSLLLISVAGSFGLIFALFVGGLTGLAVTITALVHRAVQFVCRRSPWLDTKLPALRMPLPKLSAISVVLAFFGVLMIFLLGQRDPAAVWRLVPLAFNLFVLYAIYLAVHQQLQITGKQGFWYSNDERAVGIMRNTQAQLRSVRRTVPIMAIAVVLTFSGVVWQLVEGAMRTAHIRVENAWVYVKAPYSNFLPTALRKQTANPPAIYDTFTGITVLFTGFGTSSAIEFVDGDQIRQLDIPNEYLVIEQRRPAGPAK